MDQALEIKNTDIVNELSLPPVKIHCSVLAEDAIKAAISDYKQQAEQAKPAEARRLRKIAWLNYTARSRGRVPNSDRFT